MKQRNIVKKHTFSFNKPKIELDMKKEMKKNGHTEQEARHQRMLEEEE